MIDYIQIKSNNEKAIVKIASDDINGMKQEFGVDIEKMATFLINCAANAGDEGEYKIVSSLVNNALTFALVKQKNVD